jgi:hypothetical protein
VFGYSITSDNGGIVSELDFTKNKKPSLIVRVY